MAIYSASGRTSASTAAAAIEIRTATPRVRIRECGFSVAGVAGAYNFALGIPTARGVTPTANTAIIPSPHDPGDAAAATVMAIAWATAPTTPVNGVYLRRFNLPSSLGAGVIWRFDDLYLEIPANSSLALFLLTAPTASSFLDYYFVIDE